MAELGYYNYYNVKGRLNVDKPLDTYAKRMELRNGDELNANSTDPSKGVEGQIRKLQEHLNDTAAANRAIYKDKESLKLGLKKKYFGDEYNAVTFKWRWDEHKELFAMYENELSMSMFGKISNLADPRIVQGGESFEEEENRLNKERQSAISAQFGKLLANNGVENNGALLIDFDIYEMKAVVSGSENSDNNGKIASLFNELGGGKNARQLFYFALKNNGVLSDESQQESLHKWRAVSNFADFTGLDLRDFSLKNGEFVGKDGTKALDLLKVGVANSSTPADFKGVAYEYAKGFIDEMASLGGLEKVPDLKVSIAYDKESGFYAPKSDFYA